ncbi:CurL C-terminal domain-containing protein [Veronia nyctiphanis]|nr:ketoacyl-synthetase C-terminal extension domain-containing protein [Veronia nyctiphanis]
MQRANLSPERVNYIEAHGTGTSLGDPIEINGLKKAYRQLYQASGKEAQPEHCAIGTVKTNIGHLEAAAGIAGLSKVILALKNKRLHGNIHLQEQNPYIDLAESPFYLVTESQEWPAIKDQEGDELPRCAGISSFGFGGANAHVVLEEWPTHSVETPYQEPNLILLSANTEQQLQQVSNELLEHLENNATAPLSDIAYTLQCGRKHRPHRLAVIVSGLDELKQALGQYLSGQNMPHLATSQLLDKGGDTSLDARTVFKKKGSIPLEGNKCDLNTLQDAWLGGEDIVWSEIWRGREPHRTPLPGYPFSLKRYWVRKTDTSPTQETSVTNKTATTEHAITEKQECGVQTEDLLQHQPLIGVPQENGRNHLVPLQTLVHDGYYFDQHKVAGMPVLPAAVIIEIMRAAAEKALGESVRSITGLVWYIPVMPNHVKNGLRLSVTPDEKVDGSVRLSLESFDIKGQLRYIVKVSP